MLVTLKIDVDAEIEAAARAVAKRYDLDLETITIQFWRRMVVEDRIPYDVDAAIREGRFEALCSIDEIIARGERSLGLLTDEDDMEEVGDSTSSDRPRAWKIKKRSASGMLAKYADPEIRKTEEGAWAEAAVAKHAADR